MSDDEIRPPDDDPTRSEMPDEDGAFPASENTPGQAESRSAYKHMEELLDEQIRRKESPSWWQDYLELRAEGWDWRKAVYIAWAASPAQVGQMPRWPETQEKLAREVLGLSSDRVISKWKQKHPELQLRIEQLAASPILKNLREIVDAMVTLAKTPDHNTFNDRRMALEIAGIYKPKQRQELTGANGGVIETQEAKVVVYLPDNGRDLNQTLNLRKESE